MAEESSSVINPNPKMEAGTSTVTNLTENTTIPITGYKLNGQNYTQWARSIRIFLQGKGKEDYISGDAKELEKKDPDYPKWKLENSLVMTWLLNSMTTEAGETFMYYSTAAEIWSVARETYSNTDNTSAIFEIKSLLHELRQGDTTVTDYYNTLTRYWKQLDIYEDIVWTCPEDSKQYKIMVEKDRIYQFLLGLTKHLDDVRGRILGTKPLPNIREVFSEMKREESRRKVMLGSTYQSSINEGSALAVKGSYKKSRGWCDHCKKSGHNKETCWVIHGKPADWKPSWNRDIRVHAATSEGGKVLATPTLEPSPFSKEQMEMLQKLLQQSLQNTSTHSAAALAQKGNSSCVYFVDKGTSNHLGTGTFASMLPHQKGAKCWQPQHLNQVHSARNKWRCCKNCYNNPFKNTSTHSAAALAQKGNSSCVYFVDKGTSNSWIVDSGASYHMTGDITLFDEYSPCNDNSMVRIADGTKTKVVGKGSLIISKDITLNSVLYVPKLNCNLLSISKLTQDLNCFTKFLPHLCEFQDLDSGRKVLRTDNGREYYHHSLKSHLLKHGIIHQTSCVNAPQQNGITERKNRHLMEVTRSLMLSTNVPNHFWDEAVLSASYLINRMPSKALKFKTPCQTLLSIYPHIKILSSIPPKVFGCTAFVHDNQPNKGKLEPKSLKCIFLGYPPNKKGHRCYYPISKKFYHSMDVTFFKNQPYYPKVGFQGEREQNIVEFQPWEMEQHLHHEMEHNLQHLQHEMEQNLQQQQNLQHLLET
uniref:Uncharacterized protein LOC101489272 n=1 Tax=Cicer arietinum TaxID=3827 RepID=A0A1S2Z2F8_CICAR|nr:uncharacterized protein LOC101489272 [Cicer arietinum]